MALELNSKSETGLVALFIHRSASAPLASLQPLQLPFRPRLGSHTNAGTGREFGYPRRPSNDIEIPATGPAQSET